MKNIFPVFVCLVVSMGVASEERDQEVENLRAFAKLYGYVRFFHPSDEASQLDWNAFAAYGSGVSREAVSSGDLRERLESLFKPIAPTLSVFSEGELRDEEPVAYPESNENDSIYWQHSGVLISGESNIYASVRVGRQSSGGSAGARPGILSQSVDAKPYQGMTVRYRAKAKAKVEEGSQGQLWLRVDRAGKERGFFSNLPDRPILSNSWEQYEINGEIAADATNIYFGTFLLGEGTLWMDEVELSAIDVNGVEFGIPMKNPSFEEESIIGWHAVGESFSYSLDEEEASLGNQALRISKDSSAGSSPIFDKRPRSGEVWKRPIGSGLICRFPLSLPSDPIVEDSSELLAEISAELKEVDISIENKDTQLGNLLIAWNVFQHFYPYWDSVEADWEAVLDRAIRETIEAQSVDGFHAALERMIAKTADGHGVVYYKSRVELGGLPWRLDWVEERLVVTAVEEGGPFRKGDVVRSIDGESGSSVLEEAMSRVSGSAQLRRYRALNIVGDGPKGQSALVEILRGGTLVALEVERSGRKSNLFFNRIEEYDYKPFEELDGGVVYLSMRSLTAERFEEALSVLLSAKAIIVDSRWGGNRDFGMKNFMPHLIDEPVRSPTWYVPRYVYPDQHDVSYATSSWEVAPQSPRITANVFILTGPPIVSAGETYLDIIVNRDLAETVGQSTAGTNGNVNFIPLPGGIRIMFTGMRVLQRDGSPLHGVGFLPDHPVDRTIDAIISGKDEVLELALDLID